MRIAVSAVMDSAKSGAWHVLKNIILELKEIDKNNEYIIYTERMFDDDFGKMPDNWKIVRTSITASRPILNILWHIFVLPFYLVKEKVNVLWLPWTSAAFLLKTKPTVLSILDLTEYRLNNHYSKSRMIYRKAILPISSRLASRIIAISEFTKSDIVRFLRTDPEKVDVLYCAPSAQFKVLDESNCRGFLKDKFGISQPFILYVGQIHHPNKNLVGLLHAFSRIKPSLNKPYKLVFVGKEHLSSKIVYETVSELDLTQDVVFTGYVPTEDLPVFYNAAEIFVYPSLYEGFGIPVTEAMTCGCPVITSNRSSLPEVSGDAGRLVDPDDVDEIAETMLKVLMDSAQRKQMIEKGLEQVKRFSWKDSAEKTVEIFESISQ